MHPAGTSRQSDRVTTGQIRPLLNLPLLGFYNTLRHSSRLRQRFKSTGELDHLKNSIHILRAAAQTAPSTWRPFGGSRALWMALGSCLVERYACLGDIEDLDAAIAALRRANGLGTELSSDRHRTDHVYPLCRALCLRFQHRGKLADLETAVDAMKECPAYHTLEWYTRSLCLRLCFNAYGKRSDLERSITSIQTALERVVRSKQSMTLKMPLVLAQLSICLRSRYEAFGDVRDLEKSVALGRRAMKLAPVGHPSREDCLHAIGSVLQLRSERLGYLDDLHGAINALQGELQLMRDSHAAKPERMIQLSVCLRHRFEHLGKLDDLEDALAASRSACRLQRNDHSNVTSNLRGLLDFRFEWMYTVPDSDLDKAIDRCQRNVGLRDDDQDWAAAGRLTDLGMYLYNRFERLGDPNDLVDSISVTQNTSAAGPDDCAERLMTLGRALLSRFERLHDVVDLERAISSIRMALDTIHDKHPAQRIGFVSLSSLLQHRFDRFANIDDMRDMVLARRRIVDFTPRDHRDRLSALEELGLSVESSFLLDRTLHNYDVTRACFDTTISEPLGEPSVRLRVAIRYARFLSNSPEFSSSDSLLQAHARIIDTLPEIAWLGHSIQRRFKETARLGELVNKAVGAAIGSGALRQAVEWLEAGRTLIWSQLLSLRTPLDDIGDHHPGLARSLFDIHSELQRAGSVEAGRHRELVDGYEKLMSEIRHCVGCKNFLRPRKLASLISSPAFGLFNGTLVLINVAQSSCDALVLFSTGNVRSVHLPNLTHSRAQKMHELWTRHVEFCGLRRRGVVQSGSVLRGSSAVFARVLERLWTWVVDPILQALAISRNPANGQLPHVVWCPTGPLTQLPLHAAGVYDDVQSGPRVFEFVMSSYIPSLSALLRCCDGVVKEYPAPNVLVVTQPDTPGRSPLPATQKEGALLRAIIPGNKQTLLEHKQATVDSTLAVMSRHPWIHLACHGSQNTEDPTQSAFALYDGLLTLDTLMGTVADNAELAFLSACQTAAGDEKIPEESAHLAAGMLAVGFKGVVATMWSIRDDDAPVVVEEYYNKLLEFRNTRAVQRGQTGAAHALHEATQRLRENVGEKSFDRWVPFVHYGV